MMEIFCRNVPDHWKQKHLKKSLQPILAELKIITFECQKQRNGHAIITVADESKARALLALYGRPRGRQTGQGQQPLVLMNTPIYIEEGRRKPNEFLLRSLREEEIRSQKFPAQQSLTRTGNAVPQKQRTFHITSFSCGVFDYNGGMPVFVEHFTIQTAGLLVFRRGGLVATIGKLFDSHTRYQVEISYWDVDGSIYIGDISTPSVVVPCTGAPRLFSKDHQFNPFEEAIRFLRPRYLSLAESGSFQVRRFPKSRLTSLGPEHEHIVSSCFTYRFILHDSSELGAVQRLADDPYMPPLDTWIDIIARPREPYKQQLAHFLISLQRQKFPYQIAFQLQMLVWNGLLRCDKVTGLFRYVVALLSRKSSSDVVKVLRKFLRRIPSANPQVDGVDLNVGTLVRFLTEIEGGYGQDSPDTDRWEIHRHQAAIHRATVTPTGIYLYGPYPETQNRVLRRYSSFVDYFLRVEFTEETGDRIMHDPSASLDEIFDRRYRGILRDGIIIADRHFQFLGFSHSSLRARSCWFMAPFTLNGEILDANGMISKLGKFQHIYSPARYAARIGQTFSDTFFSIAVDESDVQRVPDVERNNRVFSDGCGTFSKDILWKIQKEYPARAKIAPTVFQIRLSGAKGMISLDASQTGSKVTLRPSMVKFEAPDDWNIEICGSGSVKLPFYLNAQLIKILEDLGVPAKAFLDLQADEVKSLRKTTKSSAKIVSYLEQAHIAKSTRLPWLIQILESISLDYKEDNFLKRVIETAVLMRLRELKYRSRIKVPKAYTLYGIMDETGYLNEGQFFCPILNDQSRREVLVQPNVLITRSLALHPGDVQIVNAVDVPIDSPLHHLHNCVVFSQKGNRDLPSQLSGGDLDGDLYNVIFDTRLLPRQTSPPAAYPREGDVLLERPVQLADIADFFITFMKQDQLGRIANIHKILADQRPAGTFDPDCILLAGLHSQAVDFSKTGRAVNVLQIPKSPRCRPDFMAPGPRVQIAESLKVLEREGENTVDDDVDEDDDDVNSNKIRYYKSERVLGQLYRAIDEKAFLDEVQSGQDSRYLHVLESVWEYVEKQTTGFQWDHHIDDAVNVMEIYEDNLVDLMYQYSDVPWKRSLSEVEVFVGSIMGGDHKQTRRQIEASKNLREEFDKLVRWTISKILDEDSKFEEHLERSVACFHVALDVAKSRLQHPPPKLKKLKSFPWIAAVACLNEIEKLHWNTFPFSN